MSLRRPDDVARAIMCDDDDNAAAVAKLNTFNQACVVRRAAVTVINRRWLRMSRLHIAEMDGGQRGK